MSTTNKARKATITYNGIELEVYQLPDGSYHLSKTQVGKAIGKHRESLSDFLNGTSSEALPYKDLKVEISCVEGENYKVKLIPLNVSYSYWLYHSRNGNLTAQNLIMKLGKLDYDYGIKTFGDQFEQNVIFSNKLLKNKSIKPEKEIQLKLNEILNGLLEVRTPVGKIDILTDTLLIEIKKTKDWKAAIGQLLMYGHYYPKHRKILFLFDVIKNFDLDLVSYLCDEFNITTITSIKEIKTLIKQYDNLYIFGSGSSSVC